MIVLYDDPDMIVIDKPPGYYVHPPENDYPVPRSQVLLYRVRDTLKQHIYPVHRLDVATSGVLIFAKNHETASWMGKAFSSGLVYKKYWAVARGHTPDQGSIELPLESDSSDLWLESKTDYQTLARVELPEPVGKKFSSARYSLLSVKPQTGRFHQIRRHFNRISHPLIGDGAHGDSHHNRFFREKLQIPGLCLRASYLQITHPASQRSYEFSAGTNDKWLKIQSLFKDFDVKNL